MNSAVRRGSGDFGDNGTSFVAGHWARGKGGVRGVNPLLRGEAS